MLLQLRQWCLSRAKQFNRVGVILLSGTLHPFLWSLYFGHCDEIACLCAIGDVRRSVRISVNDLVTARTPVLSPHALPPHPPTCQSVLPACLAE